MSNLGSVKLFNYADHLNIQTLSQRTRRNDVVTANISNAETPGFRAVGYEFEEQLQEAFAQEDVNLKTSDPRHMSGPYSSSQQVQPNVFVRPTESYTQDGNTVDVDLEMAELAQNQILYRATIEFMNRKIGLLRYAIEGGR